MSPTAQAAVEVDRLVVAYGERVAVNGLSLRVAPGEVVALLGRNGAGKTSTVETVEGYRRAAAGTVRVLGLDPGKPKARRELTGRIGVMLQRGGVYPSMGPAEALRLFASYYSDPAEPGEMVDRLGLGSVARTPWRRLSGGEQQRLSMALALIGRPEVAFLDEPTAGVDPQGRLAIRQEIAGLKAGGAAVLLTTHELDEAERAADRIVIIDQGREVANGTPAELTSGRTGGQTGGQATTRFRTQPGLDAEQLGRELAASVHETRAGEYVIGAEGTPALIARLTAWLAGQDATMTDLTTGRERLEDVFLRLTGEDEPPGSAR